MQKIKLMTISIPEFPDFQYPIISKKNNKKMKKHNLQLEKNENNEK